MKPFGPAWLEEPIFPPDDFQGIARLRRESDTPIAVGENLANVMDIRNIIDAGAVDVVRPDVAKIGGVTEMLKAFDVATRAGMQLEPHSPLFGPALVATVHLVASRPEEGRCEFYFADLQANPIGEAGAPRDGFMDVPQVPGLGIHVDESILDRYRVE